ncbi:MAG: hypothetical protein JSU94_04100 [Phycisphaerales bacterium]|nr:MAG: hypothetical protein JSU94_04100 [Phycisphaerales bacterium]
MKPRIIAQLLGKVALSLLLAGLFYGCWMAAAITAFTADIHFSLRLGLWLLAPPVTAAGFAAGVRLSELLPTTTKGTFMNAFKWSLAACAASAAAVCWLGPMLIVPAMLATGTITMATREVFLASKHAPAHPQKQA